MLVAACGGGETARPAGQAAAATSELPPATKQDPRAATSFVAALASKKSESAAPLETGGDGLATSETDEPVSP